MTTKPTQVSITAPFPFEPRPLSADLAGTSSKNTAARPGPLLCHGRARRSPKDSTDRRLELLSVEESSASAEFSALNRLTDVVGNDLGHLGSAGRVVILGAGIAAMCDAEHGLGAKAFFVMDENFLLRALELLELMETHGKAWALYVFSSANAIRKYDIRQLVELGVEWIWLGLESAGSEFQKLKGADTLALVRELQAHGIRVHGSTIIGLQHHTPGNLGDVIDHAGRTAPYFTSSCG